MRQSVNIPLSHLIIIDTVVSIESDRWRVGTAPGVHGESGLHMEPVL